MLARTGAAALRHSAALLYKDVFASSMADFSSLKEKDWPALFSVFEPSQVEAYPDGFALTLEYGRDGQSGLYVIPEGMDVAPKATERSSFERIGEGIYWFHFRR